MSDNSVSKRSRNLRPRRPPPPKEKETEVQFRRRKQVTAKSVIQKKVNSDHPSLVVDDDPETVCQTISHHSSMQSKAVLTRLKPEVLQSLSVHVKNSNCPRAHHAVVSPLDKKESKPPSRIETPAIQTVINGHDLPSSENNKVCRSFSRYSSVQPKVVLTRLKPEVLLSLSDDIKSSSNTRAHRPVVSSVVDKKERKPPSRIETPVSQTVIGGHDLSSSDDSDDDDDDDNKLDTKMVRHSISHYSSSEPKVELARMKPEVFQSLSDYNKSSRYPSDHHPTFSSLVDTKENEPPNKIKVPVTQTVINGPDHPSPENGNVHTTCHSSASQPRVMLTRIKTMFLDSVPNYHSLNSNKCFDPCPLPLSEEKIETEQPLGRKRPPVRLVAQRNIKYYVASSEDEDEQKPRRRRGVQKKGGGDSFKTLKWTKSLESPPPRREKPAVRLVAQKKINYCDSSSEEENDHDELRRRRAVQKGLHESDASFSSESGSSYNTWQPHRKRNRRKQETEAALRKKAIEGNNNPSEYEKQRMQNIEEKFAFLESLKKLEADFEGFADN